MPANSTVSITLTFTPKKFRSNAYNQCGTGEYEAYIGLSRAAIRLDSTIINEAVWKNNFAVHTQSESGGSIRMNDIRASDISRIIFGKVKQKGCPATDLAVTKVSQSFVGDMDVEYKTSENKFYTYPEVKNPQPISFTAKYENK